MNDEISEVNSQRKKEFLNSEQNANVQDPEFNISETYIYEHQISNIGYNEKTPILTRKILRLHQILTIMAV